MGVKSVLTSVGHDSFCQFPSLNASPSSRRRHAHDQIFDRQVNSRDIRNLKIIFKFYKLGYLVPKNYNQGHFNIFKSN